LVFPWLLVPSSPVPRNNPKCKLICRVLVCATRVTKVLGK
jgi:hypothetical protein